MSLYIFTVFEIRGAVAVTFFPFSEEWADRNCEAPFFVRFLPFLLVFRHFFNCSPAKKAHGTRPSVSGKRPAGLLFKILKNYALFFRSKRC